MVKWPEQLLKGIGGADIMASKSSSDNLEETSKRLGVEITLDNKYLVRVFRYYIYCC